ncbi:bifunctional [glutamine synthetase] adenylyltransferase/[glutamine synthetase]-adenylyl-L-tyrosine phosphorylase [Salsipaludibacter albus]|uniref:bifunctional [glutamine synthetase] adenylyltransferase/[glutamine synthetase]-adenylyl-L-tyrosine phosphorylase n=1 Tax=Salsipaludibacter albus TaxID=2849650 RepID=UPI001EE3C95E|nr:bifunctional [glutamine synthetase] adenylyltransferase/[glutamine synthetase]-adenylyl-L-tyrosine phosphorylase [Salsipaludibacter albus]
MATSGRRHSSLARAGLQPERARRELVDAGLLDPDASDLAAVADLVDAVARVADPTQALRTLSDLATAQPEAFAQVRAESSWLGRVAAVAGASRPLGDLLARHPEPLEALADLDPVDATAVADEVRAALAGRTEDRAAAVAAVRRRRTADIAARDLTGVATVDEVGVELSALAEGVLSGTLDAVHDAVDGPKAARIAVIGMGKLGGRELNYVSDVDVVFVHEPVAADGDDHAAAAEAHEVLEDLLAILNASTTMGRAYEVDPTLRPEGRAGALSRTPGGFTAYWERWARTWEFQALLKARPVAGDIDLAQRLLDLAVPFVFPEHLDPAVVGEIRRMKGRVENKPEVRRDGERQVKLGPGGLRDIEFAVQLLQLVHGRADPSLRRTGTLPALDALAEGGYVATDDARGFAASYRLLRRVEHRLQLARERRTHTLPTDDESLEVLARALDYRADGPRSASASFLRDLRASQAQVRALHAKLFYRPLLEAHAAVSASDAHLSRSTTLGEAAARARFEALGFRDSAGVQRDIAALTTGVNRQAAVLRAVLPAFLHELADTPRPDDGLKRFRDVVEADRGNTVVSRLRDHPPTLTGLAVVLGTSPVAADLLTANPRAVLDLDPDELVGSEVDADQVAEQARGRRAWQDSSSALRRLKRRVLLQTVARDLLTHPPVTVVSRELTAIADGFLRVGLEAALDAEAAERGVVVDDLDVRMAVVAMGRLAGGELHYPSDLDVVFVHESTGDDESAARRTALAVAERLMTSLGAVTAEGTAFEVDADLRPEGRQGPLSRSLPSYRAYWERWAEPWEFQALMRTRLVAGDDDLGHRFRAAAATWAWPDDFATSDRVAMRTMKARMEKERIRRRDDPMRHIKLGPGGLVDVEWTVQYLQRCHVGGHPALRTAATMGGLDSLQDVGVIDHADADWLREAYVLLSRVRNRLYLMGVRNVDVLPANPSTLAEIATSLGYTSNRRQELDDAILRSMRHARQVVERLFYGAE